ncbi:transcription antitermination factor NusB [Oceanobacillus halophilus]|uniref:Transcription antitermination protein NusB n=1 Tax=Oceanobacillus halophilus TaxID=930130 RepID=A0A495AD09_9BACI|nr:transcription antitermination factor NusB [Oceanobacillus halophilus]RKQ37752.1 transcription antitermination factor NusB [Oceanobacillus halophilus]
MNRHTAREKAFQILFQMDINQVSPTEAMETFLEDEKVDSFLMSLVNGVFDNKEEIDSTITEHLENWTLNRIATVERNILRIATYEIKFMSDIPNNVTINEAVELGNKFGDDKSGRFINGVLSKIIA